MNEGRLRLAQLLRVDVHSEGPRKELMEQAGRSLKKDRSALHCGKGQQGACPLKIDHVDAAGTQKPHHLVGQFEDVGGGIKEKGKVDVTPLMPAARDC